jgi:hypothetical protein
MYNTYEEAQQALRDAELDVVADFGESKLESAWPDIVRSIASMCPKEIGDELIRRNLGA